MTTDNEPNTPQAPKSESLPGKFVLGLLAAYLIAVSLGGCGEEGNSRRG